MAYHLDFSAMSLAALKAKLERTDLIPSQLPLLDGIDKKLAALGKAGIKNLEDLSRALKGAKGPSALASATKVPEGYFVLLRRAIDGFRPKPARLSEFPGIDPKLIDALVVFGIRDSKTLYEAAPDAKAAAALAKEAGVDAKALGELRCLCDLSRIQWVGPTFARALFEAGFVGAARVAAAKAEEVYEAVLAANEGSRYFKGKIGLRDIGRLVILAGELG